MTKYLKNALMGLILIATFIISGQVAWADPISVEQAEAWNMRVRRIMRVAPDFDLRADAATRRQKAIEGLQSNPGSRFLLRDLADACHSLGHFAEHDHNYALALEYHRFSLDLYKKTGGAPSKESWDDGLEHAREHVFMDLYDQGVVYESSGNQNEAKSYFEKAWRWSEETLNTLGRVLPNPRFTSRYMPLLKKRSDAKLPLSGFATRVFSQYCQWAVQKHANDD